MNFRILLAAASTAIAAPLAISGNHPHWSYEGHGGAARWAELDESFKTCKLGKLQSPINIETRKVEKSDRKPIGFAYTAGAAEVVNNGHTVQVNLPAAGGITIAGEEYRLVQFHFHTPSEEKIDGKSYPLVAHLVHESAAGKLAVVALLLKEGRENAALKAVFDGLPAADGEARAIAAGINAAEMLPADRAYYAFMGSLTTPPCSEEVRWQVLRTPVEVSAGQLAAFRKLYKMNARPVQPLNGRKVRISSL